ncbi:hypothetical protein [uncultured Helicobacter sp.]|uniref:CiaD-like domain-containing protein n=1 Tax=uncultured Helicobacter sp. TaxID=175537 RepID=UPI00374E28EC
MELKDIILETINTLESDTSEAKEQGANLNDIARPHTPSRSSYTPTDEDVVLDSHPAHISQYTIAPQDPLNAQDLSARFQRAGKSVDVYDNIAQVAQQVAHSEGVAQEPKNLTPNSSLDSLSRLKPSMISVINESHSKQTLSDEVGFLKLLQDRLLVLFEGLSMPDKESQKLTMVLNFLQYQLSVIAKRLEILEDKDKRG